MLTSNEKLNDYIELAHSLTFLIKDFFLHIYNYEDRLKYFLTDFVPIVKQIRANFINDYISDIRFVIDFNTYMEIYDDFMVFCNLLISAPDERKFGTNSEDIPFITYHYQVLIREISHYFGLSLYKSREIGLSYTLVIDAAMHLIYKARGTLLFLARTEHDVDKYRDRTWTNMGRVRQVIESTVIYNIKKYDDKFLTLAKNDRCKIEGASSNAHSARQGRVLRGWQDEAGVIPNLADVAKAISMTADFVHYTGTLNPGTDEAFREKLDQAVEFDVNKLWDIFTSAYEQLNHDYRKAINVVISYLKSKVEKGKNILLHITYEHHPLKAGNCDYFKIESNKLGNDPVAIACELKADRNAGNPKRSFYNCWEEHFKSDDFFESCDFTGFRLIAGFDPGTESTACLSPAFIDSNGNSFVLPPIYMEGGSMENYIETEIVNNLLTKYNFDKIEIFAEQSVEQYKKVESGWWFAFNAKKFANQIDLIVVSNRDAVNQVRGINQALWKRTHCRFTEKQEPKIIFHEGCKFFMMYYIIGGKYTKDPIQKKISHPSEAFIAWSSYIYPVGGEYIKERTNRD